MSSHSEIFELLRDIIAEETGNDPGSITPDSDFVEDLNLEVDTDLLPIIKRINSEFSATYDMVINLNAKEIIAEAETVNDILMRLIDEVELG